MSNAHQRRPSHPKSKPIVHKNLTIPPKTATSNVVVSGHTKKGQPGTYQSKSSFQRDLKNNVLNETVDTSISPEDKASGPSLLDVSLGSIDFNTLDALEDLLGIMPPPKKLKTQETHSEELLLPLQVDYRSLFCNTIAEKNTNNNVPQPMKPNEMSKLDFEISSLDDEAIGEAILISDTLADQFHFQDLKPAPTEHVFVKPLSSPTKLNDRRQPPKSTASSLSPTPTKFTSKPPISNLKTMNKPAPVKIAQWKPEPSLPPKPKEIIPTEASDLVIHAIANAIGPHRSRDFFWVWRAFSKCRDSVCVVLAPCTHLQIPKQVKEQVSPSIISSESPYMAMQASTFECLQSCIDYGIQVREQHDQLTIFCNHMAVDTLFGSDSPQVDPKFASTVAKMYHQIKLVS